MALTPKPSSALFATLVTVTTASLTPACEATPPMQPVDARAGVDAFIAGDDASPMPNPDAPMNAPDSAPMVDVGPRPPMVPVDAPMTAVDASDDPDTGAIAPMPAPMPSPMPPPMPAPE